ncbi:hypothetical protein HXX76_005643 [Chlamydomonas incerta]|uniref:Uncharacterized protein n=1 Tax=Chlamydomonas incerta TaxID=51695 RepID=A0A835W5M4_CHLIN|nr:hypothetical protein HXX76_005643 [Chlamydomonas incerta]|eukprot:KAG2438029.1 hypothetical protein HXX76_005643 [Chlamydomonas incerta]
MLFMPSSGPGGSNSVLLLTRSTSPLALRVDLASGDCTAATLGLGTPVLSAAYDDLSPPPQAATAAAGSGGGLGQQAAYLLYADSTPVSAAACDPRGADGALDSSTSLCYPHYIVRDQPQLQRPPLQIVPFELTYPRAALTNGYGTGPPETTVLALNRRHTAGSGSSSTSGNSTSGAATAASSPVYLYLADRHRCQVRRVDPLTGASAVVAGYDDGSNSSDSSGSGSSSSGGGLRRRSFLCSIDGRDGPALGQPIGRPGRITRGAPGTLFLVEEGQEPVYGRLRLRIRRIVGA